METNTTHTPGPWMVESGGCTLNIGGQAHVAPHVDGHPHDECKATARLIASAPAMYEALMDIADLLKSHGDSTAWNAGELARIAIAKAEGAT